VCTKLKIEYCVSSFYLNVIHFYSHCVVIRAYINAKFNIHLSTLDIIVFDMKMCVFFLILFYLNNSFLKYQDNYIFSCA